MTIMLSWSLLLRPHTSAQPPIASIAATPRIAAVDASHKTTTDRTHAIMITTIGANHRGVRREQLRLDPSVVTVPNCRSTHRWIPINPNHVTNGDAIAAS